MKKKNVSKILFLQTLFVAFSCVVATCSKKLADNTPILNPKYLLEGTYASSNTYFDFYLLDDLDSSGNPQYAISLKDKIGETKKTEYTSDISINSTTCEGLNVTGIWHNAFHNCPAANITIDLPITTIDFEAFLYSGITSITIPWSVQEIGDGAFYACSNLQKVTFISDGNATSSSATTCTQCANNSCSGDICTGENGSSSSNPSSNTPSSSNASSSSSAPAASSNNDSSSSSSSGTSSNKECTLKKIPSFCFFKCNSMTELVLPSSLEEIEQEAFNGCYNLRSAIYFQNIRYIRERAFQGCSELRMVYISNSMFESRTEGGLNKRGLIEPHAFNYCGEELEFHFCTTAANEAAWLGYSENGKSNTNWGLKSDKTNAAYTYTREDANLIFTSDWSYKMDASGNITITKYNGPVPTGGFITIPDSLPNPRGYSGENRVVALDFNLFSTDVKAALERLYLPTTLKTIDNLMFRRGYDNLYVVDDNCDCYTDSQAQSIEGRIDLSGLTDLEFIGIRAFSGIGGTTASLRIKRLHLPAHLRAIGDEAFGIFSQRTLPNLIRFDWEYDGNNPRLECIGADAFYGVGASGTGEITENSERIPGTQPSTIIFPKTFKYFGMLQADKNRYKAAPYNFNFSVESSEVGSKVKKPAHAFVGCSLIEKVIFKGGTGSENLVIPLQTFVFNENLHTIVFEERPGKYIAFHTQSRASHWGQEAIGGNSGRGKNDFRGGPFLQTLVLPNKQTTLYIQDFSFHANSRAAIYLSGNLGENMYSDIGNVSGGDNWINLKFSASSVALNANNGARQWKTIGNEEWYSSANRPQYYGYNFAKTTQTDNEKCLNTFSIEQETPVYENVYYKDPDVAGVEVGSSNTKIFKVKDKCSFICEKNAQDQYVATMTNYLYDLYDGSADLTTAKVPETVTVGETNYTVTKIGDSAFSACFCDGTDDSTNHGTIGDFDDLKYVVLPNTIESIGEYAFIRAYGIEKISSYTGNADPVEGMPSSLRHIGKNAFLFSGIKQVLRIPYKCLFYESENNTTKITSVFANALSLRKITFIDTDDANAQESTESPYYKTTTYTSNREGSPKFTTALYSKNYTDAQNVTTYNKNKLMLVLNRDYVDRTVASDIVSPATKSDAKAIGTGNTAGVEFDGLYSIDGTSDQAPFLFGAYKMGVWIKKLICGSPTTYVENNVTKVYPQPLFSPVGQIDSSGTLVDRYFYLGCNAGSTQTTNNQMKVYPNQIMYQDLTVLVETISGKVLDLPQYAMSGCEKLSRVELETKSGGEIPNGVFANVTNAATNYVTEGPNGEVATVLDLRSTGYSRVGSESFKNNKCISTFVAPDVSDFTIGESAFETCTSLTTIDLSAVTGTLTIDAQAFSGCTSITNIIWPASSSAIINITGPGAFSGCTSLTSVCLPSDLMNGVISHKLADSTFSGCTKLATVTIDGDASYIENIGASAFYNCSLLKSFEFEKFTSLTTIGASAFYKTDKITSDGVISLPETLTSIGANAFNSSKVEYVNLASNSISLGTSAFQSSKIKALRFTNPDCAWTSYNYSVFNSCKSLLELQLPTGFNINNTVYNSKDSKYFFVSGDTTANIYLYEKITSSTTLTNDWRSTTGNNGYLLPTHFYVESVNDLLTAGIISKTQNNSTTLFWTTDENNQAIKLGRVTNFNGTMVTFENGSTLIADAYNSTLITSVQDLLTANAISATPAVVDTSTIYCISTGNGQLALGNIVSYDGTTVVFSYGYALSGTTLYRLANTVQDMLNSGYVSNSNGGTVEDDTTLFYGVDSDGNAELLGNISDYDGTTITFGNGTLVADAINAIEVENINSLRTGNYITDDGGNHTFDSNSVFYFVDSNDDVTVLGKITSYDGTNVVFSNGYVLTADGLHYQVSSVQDLLDSGVITNSPSVSNNQKHFYMIDSNDNIVILGTVSSYNGYTVTFSGGKTLTLDMFDAVYVDDLTDVSSAGAITDNPSPAVSDANKVFFTTRNGQVVVLGTVSSYNGTYVTFSNGCILNSDGIHYQVSSVQDLLDNGVISKGNSNTVVDGTTLFYRNNNGTITFLGHIESFDGNTVTFSEDDHTLTLNVFDAIRVEDLTGLRTGGYISDANDTHTVMDNTSTFCYVDANGNSVILGTISSYDGTNVVFSNGYVLNTTGFHKLTINVAGLVSSGAIGTNAYGAAIYDRTTSYYMVKNGQIIVLGTITSYNGTTVTFSSGYTLENSTFTAPANS